MPAGIVPETFLGLLETFADWRRYLSTTPSTPCCHENLAVSWPDTVLATG